MIPTQKDVDILYELWKLWDGRCTRKKWRNFEMSSPPELHDYDWYNCWNRWENQIEDIERRELFRIENICKLCFTTNGTVHNHHISYFPEHIERICGSCHASLNREMFEGTWIQYTKKDYKEFYKKPLRVIPPTKIIIKEKEIFFKWKQREDPRHQMRVNYKGYF